MIIKERTVEFNQQILYLYGFVVYLFAGSLILNGSFIHLFAEHLHPFHVGCAAEAAHILCST